VRTSSGVYWSRTLSKKSSSKRHTTQSWLGRHLTIRHTRLSSFNHRQCAPECVAKKTSHITEKRENTHQRCSSTYLSHSTTAQPQINTLHTCTQTNPAMSQIDTELQSHQLTQTQGRDCGSVAAQLLCNPMHHKQASVSSPQPPELGSWESTRHQ
jgi:hypothetical protein